MRMPKMLKRIIKGSCNLIIIIVVILSAVLAVPRIFGVKLIVIETGSMTPKLEVGSLCYVYEKDEIRKGDIITYYLDHNTVVTHRVVSVESDETYITKGDRNDAVDTKKVSQENIIGVVRVHIPYLGYFVSWISSLSGKMWMAAVLLVAFVVSHFLENAYYE